MANVWTVGTTTFLLDTSTNVAGLEALKGSAVTTADNICLHAPTVNNMPTLTIEKNLNCRQLNIGFGAVNGASQSNYGARLVLSDGAVITVADGQQLNVSSDSEFIANGTLRSLGTGTGAADQSYALMHADNDAVMVAGEWWTWLPSLTGERVAVTATTNTTSITCTTDPRLVGVTIGSTIEIRTRSTGALLATKAVTATSATSVSFSGAVSVTANESVYIPIAATDKVYTASGGNVIFGDGTASAYNNNGGAIPANAATITSPGITLRSSGTTTGVYWNNVRGTINLNGVCLSGNRQSAQWWGSHVYQASSPTLTNCAFVRSASHGFYVSYGCANTTINGTSYSNASSGFYVSYGCANTTINGTSYSNASYGFYVANGCTNTTINGTSYSNASSGFYVTSGCTNTTFNGTAYSNASNGVYVASGCRGTRFFGRAYSNTGGNLYTSHDHGVAYGAYRTAATGNVGELKWIASDARLTMDTARLNPRSTTIGFKTTGDYYTTDVLHVPGLTAWGTATVSWTLNSATVASEYRVSHDYGQTWTAWTAVPATITDTPDVNGEAIQFRFKRTDTNLALYEPRLSSVTVATVFSDTWTLPASWAGIHDVCAAMAPTTRYQGGAASWS